jgi:hypothetical protein
MLSVNNVFGFLRNCQAIDEKEHHEEREEDKRDALYNIIMGVTPSHGVPYLIKTLDGAIFFLKLARAIDNRLKMNPKVEEFFERLDSIERKTSQVARTGFQNAKVLVLEGLGKSGKTTLAQALQTSLTPEAKVITGLPNDLLEIRHIFSIAPDPIVTVLDFVFNYCIADQIIEVRLQSFLHSKNLFGRTLGTDVFPWLYRKSRARQATRS